MKGFITLILLAACLTLQGQTHSVPMLDNFLYGVSLGLNNEFSYVEKFGQNDDIDTNSDPEDLWGGAGLYAGHPTGSAEVVEVFSGSDVDSIGLTGALTVEIQGLDDDGALQRDTITLRGSVEVETTNTYDRVFRLRVLTGGSGGANVGAITCRHATTTANVFAVIPAGVNQSLVAAYTVPFGYTAIITSFQVNMTVSAGVAGSAIVSFRVREPGGVYRSVVYEQVTTTKGLNMELKGGLKLPALTDLLVRVENVSGNNTAASSAIGILLIQSNIIPNQ